MKELKIFLTALCTLCIFPVKAQSPEKVEEKFPIVCVDPSGRVEYVTAEAWDSVATARPDLRAEGILVVPEKNLFPRVSPFVVGNVSRREYEWNDVNDHYLPDLEQGKAINRYRKEIDKGLKALRQEQVGFKKNMDFNAGEKYRPYVSDQRIYSRPRIKGPYHKCDLSGSARGVTDRSVQYIWIRISPATMATDVDTSPGSMKEWFSIHLPMRVVPVVSKLIAATMVG